MFSSWWQPEPGFIQARWGTKTRRGGEAPLQRCRSQRHAHTQTSIFLPHFPAAPSLSCVLKGISWLQYTQNYGEQRSFDADVKRRVKQRRGDNLQSVNVVSHVRTRVMKQPFVHQATEPYLDHANENSGQLGSCRRIPCGGEGRLYRDLRRPLSRHRSHC